MKNSPEMLVFIAATERYLLSLSREELNKRIDSRRNGEIGELILQAGFLEKEDWSDEYKTLQCIQEVEYIKEVSIQAILNEKITIPSYFSIAWSKSLFDGSSISRPSKLSEIVYVQKSDKYFLSQHDWRKILPGNLNDYNSEDPESWRKIA